MLRSILTLSGAQKLGKDQQINITGGGICPEDQELAEESCRANQGLWVAGPRGACGVCLCHDLGNH